MTNPSASADFFALEAGETLDRLEKLVAGEGPPPGEAFLRASRVLRGAALMVGMGAAVAEMGHLVKGARR